MAATADQGVVASKGLEEVMTGTTVEAIAQGTAPQGVVPLQSIDPVGDVHIAAQPVGAGGGAAHHHLGPQIRLAPHHPIAEAEALHPEGGLAEVVENPHRVPAAIADHQIGIEALGNDFAGGNIQPAQFILKAIAVQQRVAAITASHHIEVIARPSAKEIITGAALESIVPLQPREAVGAGIAQDPVGGSRARKPIGSGPSRDQSLDREHRAEQHGEGIPPAADSPGQGAKDGGPGGTHARQAAGEPKQGPRIGQGSAVGRQGPEQGGHLEAEAAIRLHRCLQPPEQGAQLHLGREQTVDGLPQPREGRLQGVGDPSLGHLGPGDAAKAPAHQLLHGPQAPVGVLITCPAGQHLLLNAGPGKDQGLDQGRPLHRIARDPLLQQGRQGAIGAGGDGLVQPGHQTHAPQLRQGGDGGGHGKGVQLTRAGGIDREPHVMDGQHAAIEGAVGAELAVAIALGIAPRRFGIGEGKALHTALIKAEQLPWIGFGIGIGIQPEPQFRPDGISAIDAAIAIAIEAPQGFKAMAGQGAIPQARAVAEELVARGDPAVTITIPHQQGIATADPAGAFREAIAIVVELDGSLPDAAGGDTVAVEVEHQG